LGPWAQATNLKPFAWPDPVRRFMEIAVGRCDSERMAQVGVTSRRSARSQAALTEEHLARLAALAEADHQAFTRVGGRPEYRSRRLAVVLAQGAALHFLDGRTGVKDLDVWTFYAAIPGMRFPADRRETHADFGPSSLGRQTYDFTAARNARERALWRRWSAYEGRRVDFMMRALQVDVDGPLSAVLQAVQGWVAKGSRITASSIPSAWYLSKKAGVLLYPESRRGEVLWRSG